RRTLRVCVVGSTPANRTSPPRAYHHARRENPVPLHASPRRADGPPSCYRPAAMSRRWYACVPPLAPVALVVGPLAVATPAAADRLLVPDAPLVAKATGYERQELTFSTRESGIFLDTVINPADVAAVKAFFAQSQELDFQKQTGRHPYEVVAAYAEYGDEGN